MTFQLHDRTFLDDAAKVRFTDDGYLVAMPRVARTGIQLYRGSELGLTGDEASRIIRVYRPEAEVFSTDSMATYAHKPMTDDHPPEAVNAKNWSRYGKGQMGDEIARDGQAIRVPMVLMDHGLVQKFRDGKAELSVGYGCDIEWTPGQTADGKKYDCSQKNIRINHCAVVDAARAGPEFRIGDGSGSSVDFNVYADALAAILKGNINKDDALADASGHLARDSKGTAAYPLMKDGTVYLSSLRACKTDAIAKSDGDVLAAVDTLLSHSNSSTQPTIEDGGAKETKTMANKTIIIDGISVEVGDGPHAGVIERHIKTLSDSVAKLTTDLSSATATHAQAITAKDGEIAKLTTDLSTATVKVTTLEKQVADAVLTPAKLDALVADRAVVQGKARVVMGDKASTLIVDGKTDSEIRRQVVDAQLGALAKGWSDDQVKTSFDTLTKDVDLSKLAAHDAQFIPGGVNDQRLAFSMPPAGGATMIDAALDARDARLQNAWKGEQPTKQ